MGEGDGRDERIVGTDPQPGRVTLDRRRFGGWGRRRSAIGSMAGGSHAAAAALCSPRHQREIRSHRILNRRIHVLPILALHGLDDLAAFLLDAAEAFGEVAHR